MKTILANKLVSPSQILYIVGKMVTVLLTVCLCYALAGSSAHAQRSEISHRSLWDIIEIFNPAAIVAKSKKVGIEFLEVVGMVDKVDKTEEPVKTEELLTKRKIIEPKIMDEEETIVPKKSIKKKKREVVVEVDEDEEIILKKVGKKKPEVEEEEEEEVKETPKKVVKKLKAVTEEVVQEKTAPIIEAPKMTVEKPVAKIEEKTEVKVEPKVEPKPKSVAKKVMSEADMAKAAAAIEEANKKPKKLVAKEPVPKPKRHLRQ